MNNNPGPRENRCPICGLNIPLTICFINPALTTDLENVKNIVFLCKSCRRFVFKGYLSIPILMYYKENPVNSIAENVDPINIYERAIVEIKQKLENQANPRIIYLARAILLSLKKHQVPEFRRAFLDLVVTLLIASTLQTGSMRILDLTREGKIYAKMLGKEGNWFLKQILHYEGLENNKNKLFERAIPLFQESLNLEVNGNDIFQQKSIEADRYLTQVHLSASMWSAGQRNKSLDYLRRTMEESEFDFQNQNLINAYCHAQNKLAEHYIQRGKFTLALEILSLSLLRDKETNYTINPIYRAVLYKDLGRVFARFNEKETALNYFLQSILICNKFGYSDQRKKVVREASQGGIYLAKFINSKVDHYFNFAAI